jgi:hypothetical protein
MTTVARIRRAILLRRASPLHRIASIKVSHRTPSTSSRSIRRPIGSVARANDAFLSNVWCPHTILSPSAEIENTQRNSSAGAALSGHFLTRVTWTP